MLKKRGYYVKQEELEMTFESFRTQFGIEPKRDELTILAVREINAEDQIYVFFVDDEQKDKISNKVVSTCVYFQLASSPVSFFQIEPNCALLSRLALQHEPRQHR